MKQTLIPRSKLSPKTLFIACAGAFVILLICAVMLRVVNISAIQTLASDYGALWLLVSFFLGTVAGAASMQDDGLKPYFQAIEDEEQAEPRSVSMKMVFVIAVALLGLGFVYGYYS